MCNRDGFYRRLVAGGGALLLSLPALSAYGNVLSAPPPTFDRYQVILTRMPFGDETLAAATAAAVAAAAGPAPESFAKNLRLCAITRDRISNRIQVGLLDTVSKTSFFMYEGEKSGEMLLVKADFENEKVLLRQGGEEASVDLNSATSAGGAGVVRGSTGIPPRNPFALAGSSTAVPMPLPDGSRQDLTSGTSSEFPVIGLLSRRRDSAVARRERDSDGPEQANAGVAFASIPSFAPAVQRGTESSRAAGTQPVASANPAPVGSSSLASVAPVVQEQASPTPSAHQGDAPGNGTIPVLTPTQETGSPVAELQRKLMDYQRGLIIAGGDPLPIQLTPELDLELVKKGFLPPEE